MSGPATLTPGDVQPQDETSALVERSWVRRTRKGGEPTERPMIGEGVTCQRDERIEMTGADVYRQAMTVIRDCATECDPKAFALGRSSFFHEHGDFEEATRWAEIAHVIDELLRDVTRLEHIPGAQH
jgi:hypothetical protein